MVANITLTYNGTSITIETTRVEELKTKQINAIPFPSGSANWNKKGGSGTPKSTKIMDTQRVRTVFNVDGWVAEGDLATLRNIMEYGGTFTMTYVPYNASAFNVNMEKYSLLDDAKTFDRGAGADNPDYYLVKFSVIVGEDM